jgi:hypothetical protein
VLVFWCACLLVCLSFGVLVFWCACLLVCLSFGIALPCPLRTIIVLVFFFIFLLTSLL